MTVVERDTTSAATVIERARQLAPSLAARAPEIETARRLPADVLAELMEAGCFRIVHPSSYGGVGADLTTALRLFETLAAADASVGWTVALGATSWCDLSALPRQTFDAMFGTGEVIVAGAFAPGGSIERDGDTYRVSGRWAFASGCEHATWLFGNCIEGVVDGMPQMRIAVFAPEDVTIEDTWNVSGLCGSGSHHFNAKGVTIPAERTFRPFIDEPAIAEAIVHVPPPALFSLVIASVALGTAQGAVDDIVAIAQQKVPLLAQSALAGNPLFQHELGIVSTELRAARALLGETADAAWTTASQHAPWTLQQRAEVRAAAAWVVQRAAAIVDTAYRSGGGSAVYADCPLQRRLRDIHAITQHFLVKPDTLTTAGAIFAGLEPAVMVF